MALHLKNIKLAGFKSFADPTIIPIQNRLTAIVGPNGCGKSNVVDAVRCVLSGAARHLRGDNLTDIIFNGSENRKLVGQAAVEMTFDNSDGTIGGEYAGYQEICIRREINRDGQSNYYLNNTRCRRRDITDIFLGTGLGPQSYAIIEQGMISRIIEAKPEELRIYLEEAAGISKYKERRRETENRIQHTRENLERLNDHRAELEKQLAHLKRQANAAERYKELKQEERTLKAELQALHWRELGQQIASQDATIKDEEIRLEAEIAKQRQLDANIEKLRQQKITHQDAFEAVQGRFYSLGAEIARMEQHAKHSRERQAQLQTDLASLDKTYQELKQSHEQDQFQAEELKSDLIQLEPRAEQAINLALQATQAQNLAEEKMQDWQMQWDEFNTHAAKTARAVEVEQMRMQHLEQATRMAEQRITKAETERSQFDFALLETEINALTQQDMAAKKQLQDLQEKIVGLTQQINQERSNNQNVNKELDELRNRLQSWRGRLSSLEALQQAALGKNDGVVTQWLEQQQLKDNSRLVENIRVASGWELAVETVLGPYLEAVCVDDLSILTEPLKQLAKGNLALFKPKSQENSAAHSMRPTLLNKVESPWSLQSLLSQVYVAEDLAEALNMSASLMLGESVITRDGIWLGNNWLRIAKNMDAKAGILQRESELQELRGVINQQQQILTAKQEMLLQAELACAELEKNRERLQNQYHELAGNDNEVQSQLSANKVKLEQLHHREQVIAQELTENHQQLQEAHQQLVAAKTEWQLAQEKQQADIEQKEALLQQREALRQQLDEARQQARDVKQAADEVQMQLETTRNQLHYLLQSIHRAEKQLQDSTERRETLAGALNEIEGPLQELKQQLAQALDNRLAIEHELNQARQALNHIEHELRENEENRNIIIESVQNIRSQLEQMRMKLQALQIRQTTHQEKIAEFALELNAILAQLPELAMQTEWEEKIIRLENRIQRLGPINLAAIDEYNKLEERKVYLDAQNNDLVEALTTLENAIRKIDRETRARLQEVYDKVNERFNQLFQRIFGGGSAGLELTGEDLLATGILVKAQPLGKRNTTIHLLSGGEKALTAVALVFSLFQLNPAPFCILDEVDAPLDDVNVGRFCNLLKEMSQTVQFIFISHNKLSIETAEQLIGVTMNEPGVSRLVSVNIDQAIAMATA